jgi:hypothetical protein
MKRDQVLDRQYFTTMFEEFYRAQGFGSFEEKYTAFLQAHPELKSVMLQWEAEDLRKETIAKLKGLFRVADQSETEGDAVRPPHLRQLFLRFTGEEIPPMSATISVPGGRIAAGDASASQQRDHHRKFESHHASGLRYRRQAREGWESFIEHVQATRPDIPQPETIPLQELAEKIKDADTTDDTDASPLFTESSTATK